MDSRDKVLIARTIAREQLATLRRNQSHGLSLKKAVRRKLATITTDAETKQRVVIPATHRLGSRGWEKIQT